jgi:Tfp pilus assembly protein PilO
MVKTPVIRAYFSLIASLFALSFFGAFAIRPTVNTIVELQKKITDASFTNQKLQEKINALSEAQTQYSLVQADLPIVFSALPKDPDFSSLLKQIENIAVASGVSVTGIQFQSVLLFDTKKTESTLSALTQTISQEQTNPSLAAVPPSLDLTPISFSLSLRGGYPNIKAFLTSLSHLSRLIDVNSFNISNSQSGIAELTINMQTKAFYYE